MSDDYGQTDFGATGLVLDMTQAGDNGFDLLDPGSYAAFVYDIEAKTSNGAKTKGTPMLKVTYKLADQQGRVWDNIVLNATSAWKFKQLATAAGIPAAELTGQVDVGALIPQIKGQQVILDLAVETGNDQYPAKNVVRKVSSFSGQMATTLPQSFSGIAWDKVN